MKRLPIGVSRVFFFFVGSILNIIIKCSKLKIHIYNKNNIPKDTPIIFVANHFTRIETFILPKVIFDIIHKLSSSLADSSLFVGTLGKFLKKIGTISTKDPDRDEVILNNLKENIPFIIFPEGSMIKDKKVVNNNEYEIFDNDIRRIPHKGAAVLAMKFQKKFNIDIMIIPVNITFTPISGLKNILSKLINKLIKNIPDRFLEEIEVEGNMLLSSTNMDITFGEPIKVKEYMNENSLEECSINLMKKYMSEIYKLTKITRYHLWSFLLADDEEYTFHTIRRYNPMKVLKNELEGYIFANKQ
jgi:1-acyl-sn-glycerol-3-phosphate acyltransferase